VAAPRSLIPRVPKRGGHGGPPLHDRGPRQFLECGAVCAFAPLWLISLRTKGKRRERTDRAALQIDFKHMPGLTRSGIRVRSSSITCLSLSDGIGDDNFNPPIDLPSSRGVVAGNWSCLAQTASAHHAIRLKAAV